MTSSCNYCLCNARVDCARWKNFALGSHTMSQIMLHEKGGAHPDNEQLTVQTKHGSGSQNTAFPAKNSTWLVQPQCHVYILTSVTVLEYSDLYNVMYVHVRTFGLGPTLDHVLVGDYTTSCSGVWLTSQPRLLVLQTSAVGTYIASYVFRCAYEAEAMVVNWTVFSYVCIVCDTYSVWYNHVVHESVAADANTSYCQQS